MGPSQPAPRKSTSDASYVEDQRRQRENRAGARCIARLKRSPRENIARIQPAADYSTGASSSSPIQCSASTSRANPPYFPRESPPTRAKSVPRAPHRSIEPQIPTKSSPHHHPPNPRSHAAAGRLCEMTGRQSKRTSAPTPQAVPPLGAQPSTLPAIPSMFGPGAWCPPCPLPQPTMPSSALNWLTGLQQPGMAGSSSAQGPWWAPAGIGAPVAEDPDVQAWGVDSHPPGGFVNFLKKNTSPEQDVSNGSSSQPINVCDDTNDGRTEKRLPWTKEEDCVLVGAWLNNSKDPIQSNYKKNDQYWKDVAAAYNSATPKNRARQVKHVKNRFGRIKKKVAWFCAT